MKHGHKVLIWRLGFSFGARWERGKGGTHRLLGGLRVRDSGLWVQGGGWKAVMEGGSLGSKACTSSPQTIRMRMTSGSPTRTWNVIWVAVKEL